MNHEILLQIAVYADITLRCQHKTTLCNVLKVFLGLFQKDMPPISLLLGLPKSRLKVYVDHYLHLGQSKLFKLIFSRLTAFYVTA